MAIMGGKANQEGILMQNYAALSLFLQFLKNQNFSHIYLEAPKFQDFNLVFNDGKKIICESKYRKKNFSYGDLKIILSSLIRKQAIIDDNDEILIIYRNADDDFINNVNNIEFIKAFQKKIPKGFDKYSDSEIKLLNRVKFWHIDENIFSNEEIIFELFSDLLSFWIPYDKLKEFVNNLFVEDILKKSAKGDIFKKDDIWKKINQLKDDVVNDGGFYCNEINKKAKQFSEFRKAINNNRSYLWARNNLSALSTKTDFMSYAIDVLKKKKINDLKIWSGLWQLNTVHAFSFGIFDIFENNLQNKKNREYVIEYIGDNLGRIRGYYQMDFFENDVTKILNKIIEFNDKSYLEKSFEIIKKILDGNKSKFLYIKDGDDLDYKKRESCKSLGRIYDLAKPKLKDKIYNLIIDVFNLIEDDGHFDRHTPSEIFSIIESYLIFDWKGFENRFSNLINNIVLQYQKIYDEKFTGWEWMGGGIEQSGNSFFALDRHFVHKTLRPALLSFYQKDTDAAWNYVLSTCPLKDGEVNAEKPDFLARTALPIFLDKAKNGDKQAFEILNGFIVSPKGIPNKSDLIFQYLKGGEYSEEMKLKLVEVSHKKYGFSANPFIKQIISDLEKSKTQKIAVRAKEIFNEWLENPKSFSGFHGGDSWAFNIQSLINSVDDSVFLDGVEKFKNFISGDYFINKMEYFDTHNFTKILNSILNRDIEIGLKILNELKKLSKPSRNQQILMGWSLFSTDKQEKIEILDKIYQEYLQPFLEQSDNNSRKIAVIIDDSNSREAFLWFAEKILKTKSDKEHIKIVLEIVKAFINDLDPYPNESEEIDPKDQKGEYSEHKRIEKGEMPSSITSVRGWCAWVLMMCSALEGRDYIDEIIILAKQLIEDKNYYVKHMACHVLKQLAAIRLTYLPNNSDKMFFDLSAELKTEGENLRLVLEKSKDIEESAFNLLEWLANLNDQNKDSIQNSLALSVFRVFGNIRAINAADAERFFNAVEKMSPKAVANAVPLLLYFAELRQFHYKNWKWQLKGLYDDLEKFDNKPFQERLKKIIEKHNKEINSELILQLRNYLSDVYKKEDDAMTYLDAIKAANVYLEIILKKHDSNVFEYIYTLVHDNIKINSSFDICYKIYKSAIEKEKDYFNDLYNRKVPDSIPNWPSLWHDDILMLISIKDTGMFLDCLDILFDYPKGVCFHFGRTIGELQNFSPINAKAEVVFKKLVDRDMVNFYEIYHNWLKKK